MIVYKLDEHLLCRCGHEWEEHHHGVVMNLAYNDYPLNIRGCIAQECEHNQVNGEYFLNKGEKKYCKCNNFSPRSYNVLKIVKAWRVAHGQPA
jgi:hypothetical protein